MKIRVLCAGIAVLAATLALMPQAASAGPSGSADRASHNLPVQSSFGILEAVDAVDGRVRVRGWAIDPNANLSTYAQVFVDGQSFGVYFASINRPDVGRWYPQYGPNHGFDFTLAVADGTHEVCVTAVSYAFPTATTRLGCRTVTLSNMPFGALDVSEHSGVTILTAGWVIDPNTTAPISVHLYIDGVFAAAAVADASRPDLVPHFPSYGPNHGFLIILPDRPGNHTVCVWAINVGPGTGNPLIGCKNI